MKTSAKPQLKNIHGEEVKHPHVILEVFKIWQKHGAPAQYDPSPVAATHWAGRCPHCGYIHHHGYGSDDGLAGLGSRSNHCSEFDVHMVRVGSHPEGWYFLLPDRTRPFPEELDRQAYAAYLERIEKATGLDMREYQPEWYPERLNLNFKVLEPITNAPA